MNYQTVEIPKGRPGQAVAKATPLDGGMKHHMTEMWEWAEKANIERPLPTWTPPWAFWNRGALQQEWVPTSALQESRFNSRIETRLDHDHIERLKDSYPWPGSPIVVRKDSFEILDGNHRWHACFELGINLETVPIVEVDVDDAEALLIAIAGNAQHGRGLSLSERCHWAREILGTHPKFSDNLIASITGATRQYVWEQRAKLRQAELRKAERENREPMPEPDTRIGLDGRETRVRHVNGLHVSPRSESERTPKRNPISSFTPDAEEAYEEPYREVEEEVEHGTTSPVAPSVETGAGETRHSPAPDPWARFKKADSPEEAWLTDFALCMERCPFIGGRDLDEAVERHPEAKRVKGALEIVRMLAEVTA